MKKWTKERKRINAKERKIERNPDAGQIPREIGNEKKWKDEWDRRQTNERERREWQRAIKDACDEEDRWKIDWDWN